MCISFGLMKRACTNDSGKQLSVLTTVLSIKLNVSNITNVDLMRRKKISSININQNLNGSNCRENEIDHTSGIDSICIENCMIRSNISNFFFNKSN